MQQKISKRPLSKIRKDMEALVDRMGIKVRFKDEWWLMKLLGFLLFFNKNFMTSVTTTFGDTVAFPNREFIERDDVYIRVMMHELIHIRDKRHYGAIPYGWLYLVPQVFAVFSLMAIGAFWNIEYLWFLLCLGFLAPWPSPGRVWSELRGYTLTLCYYYWYNGMPLKSDSSWIRERLPWLINHFVGWGYYKMSWLEKTIISRLGFRIRMIKNRNALFNEIPLVAEIYSIFFPEEKEDLMRKYGEYRH